MNVGIDQARHQVATGGVDDDDVGRQVDLTDGSDGRNAVVDYDDGLMWIHFRAGHRYHIHIDKGIAVGLRLCSGRRAECKKRQQHGYACQEQDQPCHGGPPRLGN